MSEGDVQPPTMKVAEAHNVGEHIGRSNDGRLQRLIQSAPDTFHVPKAMFESVPIPSRSE